MAGVLIRRGETPRHKQRRWPCEDRGRDDWGDAATGHQLHAKNCWRRQRLEEASESLRREHGPASTLTLDFQPQDPTRTHFCCFKLPVCGNVPRHPQEMSSLETDLKYQGALTNERITPKSSSVHLQNSTLSPVDCSASDHHCCAVLDSTPRGPHRLQDTG